jgi:hypothetical protein
MELILDEKDNSKGQQIKHPKKKKKVLRPTSHKKYALCIASFTYSK